MLRLHIGRSEHERTFFKQQPLDLERKRGQSIWTIRQLLRSGMGVGIILLSIEAGLPVIDGKQLFLIIACEANGPEPEL